MLDDQSTELNEDAEVEQWDANGADEFEEITSEEVDRVVTSLEDLMETVESENIRSFLEDMVNSIQLLVYEESDLEEETDDDATGDIATDNFEDDETDDFEDDEFEEDGLHDSMEDAA